MLKKFLMKKAVAAQAKNLPKNQQEKLEKLVEENPDLMIRIAKEVQTKVKAGESQQAAMMKVFKEHQDELRRVLGA